MMMMIPEAFGVKYHISQDKRAFYEYHANFMEPWDGPAAMVFTDGIRIGATLDRNGLRPCRYTLTSDGFRSWRPSAVFWRSSLPHHKRPPHGQDVRH